MKAKGFFLLALVAVVSSLSTLLVIVATKPEPTPKPRPVVVWPRRQLPPVSFTFNRSAPAPAPAPVVVQPKIINRVEIHNQQWQQQRQPQTPRAVYNDMVRQYRRQGRRTR